MPTNRKGYMKKYHKKIRLQLVTEFGGQCSDCGETGKLQFAHMKPTKLFGRSRGFWQRINDIRNNRKSYRLLCIKCHMKMDDEDQIS